MIRTVDLRGKEKDRQQQDDGQRQDAKGLRMQPAKKLDHAADAT